MSKDNKPFRNLTADDVRECYYKIKNIDFLLGLQEDLKLGESIELKVLITTDFGKKSTKTVSVENERIMLEILKLLIEEKTSVLRDLGVEDVNP
jgi:hypothetical protein